MVLPKIKDLKNEYENDPFKLEWISCNTAPFISKLILTEEMIEKRISEASQASSFQQILKATETHKKENEILAFESTSTFKYQPIGLNGYSGPKVSSLDYVPDSSYNNFIDSLKDSCKKLSSICLEKSQLHQTLLLSEIQKQFEKIQQNSKNLTVYDARKITFPASVTFEKQELCTTINQTLTLLFQRLLEEECKQWENKIPSDLSEYNFTQEKLRSDSLKEYYQTSLESLKNNSHTISLPDSYRDSINATRASTTFPQFSMFPFNKLDSKLDTIPADYKDKLKQEVVNMYLLHFGSSTKKAE